MADQQNRGGQKVGQRDPHAPDAHRTQGEKPERPAEGQPGGPKQNQGGTRSEHSGKKD